MFRLGALKRGLEERQLVRSKCDSRENKLEKTKGVGCEKSSTLQIIEKNRLRFQCCLIVSSLEFLDETFCPFFSLSFLVWFQFRIVVTKCYLLCVISVLLH